MDVHANPHPSVNHRQTLRASSAAPGTRKGARSLDVGQNPVNRSVEQFEQLTIGIGGEAARYHEMDRQVIRRDRATEFVEAAFGDTAIAQIPLL